MCERETLDDATAVLCSVAELLYLAELSMESLTLLSVEQDHPLLRFCLFCSSIRAPVDEDCSSLSSTSRLLWHSASSRSVVGVTDEARCHLVWAYGVELS